MTIDLRRLARRVWERRWPLLKLHAAVGVAAVVYALLMPRWYASSATLVPEVKDAFPLDPRGLGSGLALGPGGVGTPQDQLRMVVRSRSVADSVIQTFDLLTRWKLKERKEARDKLAEHVTVSTPLEGQVVLTVEARTPGQAFDMANAYVAASQREAVRLKASRAAQGRRYLEARLETLDRELSTAAQRVRVFEEQHGVISIEDQTTATLAALQQLRAQQSAVETELAAAIHYFAPGSQPVTLLRDRVSALDAHIDRLARTGATQLKETDLPLLNQRNLELTREQAGLLEVGTLLRLVYEQVRVEASDPVPTFSVLDAPALPERASRPRRGLTVLIWLGLSAFYTLVFLQWRDHRERRPEVLAHRAQAQAETA